jgi:hypothetical protein
MELIGDMNLMTDLTVFVRRFFLAAMLIGPGQDRASPIFIFFDAKLSSRLISA